MPYGHSQKAWDSFTPEKRQTIKAQYNQNYAAVAPGVPVGAYTPEAYAPPPPPDYGPAPAADYGPAPDYGGGGYAMAEAAPPPPPKMLGESPEWLAYLNALGLEEGQFRADVDRSKGLYQADRSRQLADLPPAFGQQRRGIAGSAETRGMARSGELLRRLAENRASEGRQAGGIESALAGQLSGLESQLAQKMMDIGARRASQELQLRAQGYQ